MKIKNAIIITSAGILITSTVTILACETIIPFGYCAGTSGQGANCSNGCEAIDYTPENQQICYALGEGQSGMSDCTQKCVNVWEHIHIETPIYIGSYCGCGLPETNDDEPAGSCNQDEFPPGATSCP
ncbi:MAG TPA: hypothetical protein VJT54_16435 [Verrucomicrobiae bacterium]|nr:hypothetical protein [Verrucomicrobiae bacterium]